MSPLAKLTLSFLSVWHVWVVRTAQHAPGLCLHYIKHNRLTLAGPIPCTTSTRAAPTRSDPLSTIRWGGTGENNPITLQHTESWSNGGNIKTMSGPVTYLMDPGREGWGGGGDMARQRSVEEKGEGIGGCGGLEVVSIWQNGCSGGKACDGTRCPWANCHSNHFN